MKDAGAAVDLAVELAGCTEPPQLVALFGRLGDLVGAEGVVATATRDWMADIVLEAGDPAIYRPELLQAIRSHWGGHPFVAADLTRPRAEAMRVSDALASTEWSRRAIFNDFYRPLGMTHELSVQLSWAPGGGSCCLALQRGGSDYGERERGLLELLAPHLRAARSRLVSSRSPSPDDVPGPTPSPSDLAERLPITPREAEVLALLVAGGTNDGIAHELGISRHTVTRHIEHIYAKLDVHTRAAATRRALRSDRLGDEVREPPEVEHPATLERVATRRYQ